MAAGMLDVLLGLDAVEFTSGLTKAEYDAKRFRERMEREFAAVGKFARIGFAGAAAGAALLTKAGIDAADHLNDLSRATGVVVEDLGGIGFAASQAGSDLDGVANAFGKFNLRIAEAARGEKEASEAFRAMGISIKDAAGVTRSADVVFKDVATAIASYGDGPKTAALANTVFGRSYQALLPLLADGGKALQDNIDYYKRFGGVTTETAQAADQFNDTLGKFHLVTGQLGRNLTVQLLPPLQAVTDELLRIAEASRAFDNLAKTGRVAFETIAVLGANVKFTFEGVGREIATTVASMEKLTRLDFAGAVQIQQWAREADQQARRDLDALEKRILGLAAGDSLAIRVGVVNPDRALERLARPAYAAPSLAGPEVKRQKETIDENTQAYARFVETLAAGLDAVEQFSKVQEVTRMIEQSRFGALIPQQRELLLLLAQQIDAQDEYGRKVAHNAEQAGRVLAEAERFQANIDRLTGRNAIKEQERAIRDLNLAFETRQINFVEYMLGISNATDGAFSSIRKTNEAAEQLALTFSSSIGAFIENGGGVRDFFDSLMQDLAKLTTQLLITKPLAEGLAEAFGGEKAVSSGGMQIANFANIGKEFLKNFLDGFGGAKALGGPVDAGQAYLVGEQGPELFVPRGAGRIVPNNEVTRGRSLSVVNNFTLVGEVSRATQNQLAARNAESLNRANVRMN